MKTKKITITKERFIRLLKAKILEARRMQDFLTSTGRYERAEVYKRTRWNYEDILDLLTKPSEFEKDWNAHFDELMEIEKEGL